MATSSKAASTGAAGTTSGGATSKGESATIEQLEADIRKLREDVAVLTRHLKESGDATYKGARKAASERAEKVREQGEAAMESLRDSAYDIEDQVSDAVRRKPITALAIAAGVGYLFALSRR